MQIGITLVDILIGAASGATIAHRLQEHFAAVAYLAPYSGPLGLGVVVLAVTFLTLILGKLVPKQLAVGSPERLSRMTAPVMALLLRLAMPAVYLLSGTTRLVVRLLGVHPSPEPGATEEDIRGMIKEAALAGEVELAEKFLLERIFR
ncbi:CNNM domain-containing protein [Desulfatitalea alkaliphila]|uniref:CNNM domain-containing protein n=1 Tax=Desulfatitalea alkaliphila TaxID=2929485 RepID=A0AA41R0D9_9BACT|nr:CNNM domain-containing protein [Desulfatitalea alkaliphila]